MTEALTDSTALIGRHLRHLLRVPERLLSVTLMPVMYVVVFGFLFGSAMQVEGGNYREYIMAGIFAQVMLANLQTTAVGVVDDLRNGLVDRFRSLPMSRYAVLVGRTVSDLMLSGVAIVVMSVVGYLIGWRVHTGLPEMAAAFGMLLLLGLGASWLGALLGLSLRNVEAVSAVMSMVMMPLTFLSSAFIPLSGLPDWLRAIAVWNPLSMVVGALRELFGNPTSVTDTSFPSTHPIPVAVGLIVVMIAVAMPLAAHKYRTAAAR
ncbi:ABC transporter permease [Streptomyces anulatus]|uniref:ABC transporter permease n=1 Tax=Streptomyces TaxID=1883 RepID=UPI00067C4C60|nr:MULTISPECIES: ABC transporter permease [Streptomyces]KND35055.1 ABC transporter [Streptomyces europaeiscabiei]MDF9805384.1 ABC-2 type transport system permease protein [Streptomyces sp. HB372]KPL31424.1 ABC transporter [Streptomyces anulatus]KQX37107.1 ABC transporter [Streptomyces sp. Root1295]KRA43829.1 ABC transporter [Streptomyces sp. Root63]